MPGSAPSQPTRSLMPSWLPRFNKAVTNRIQGIWAPYLLPWAVVCHTGRKSGRVYRSPVTAFRRGDLLAIGLPYGSDAQWVKNVLAADGAEVIRRGQRLRLVHPRVVTAGTSESLPRVAAALSKHMGVLVCDIA